MNIQTIRKIPSKLAESDISFVMPAVIVMILLVLFPTVYTVVLSLFRWNITESAEKTFIGFNNYITLFSQQRFWLALGRTLLFTTTSTALTIVLGIVLAVLLNRRLPAKNILRTFLITPMIVTPVVVGLTWRFMYNSELGMLNYFLTILGFDKFPFLGRTSTSLLSVIVTDIWQYTPFAMLIILAGLESLPKEPFEAAQIDGASSWHSFRFITLPLLRGPILVTVLFRVMFAFNTFDTIYVMTGGGPGRSSETLTMYAYRLGFEQWHMGETAAAALIMLVIVIITTRNILKVLRQNQE